MRHAFSALDRCGRSTLAQALLDPVERFDRTKDGTMVVPSTYLEVVVRRR